jgi:predicted flavoprotein YhiN
MIINNVLVKRIENMQITLQEEMKISEQGLCGTSILQLKTIHNELENMKSRIDFTPIFPKFIIDSWDFNDKLGQELMELFIIYEKHRNDL